MHRRLIIQFTIILSRNNSAQTSCQFNGLAKMLLPLMFLVKECKIKGTAIKRVNKSTDACVAPLGVKSK